MKISSKVLALFFFAMALGAAQYWASDALAQSTFFTSRGCVNCHTAPTVATCNGCHHHGNSSLKAVTNKTSYAPGETVTATLSGGSRTGWIRAVLYDQSGTEIARSSGNASGMGSSATFPAALTSPAPTTPGTYTWKMAYFGNLDGSGTGDVHGEKTVNTNSFTVASVAPPADTTAPVVSAFTLPATAASLTVPVSSLTATDAVGVTGYLITTSATKPAASAAGWSATAPASVSAAAAGSVTFYAWAKDAAGNVSLSKSAAVTITVSTTDTTKPTLSISALANGAYTNKVTLNVSGNASDAGGLQSVTVNGQAVVVNADGSFSAALTLVAGANNVTVIAIDKAGNQQTDTRSITYDPTAPILTVSAPADNSSSAQSFIALAGTINENSTVTVTDNNGSPQSASINGSNFSATINLVSGVNTIVVTATDLAGNTTSAKRTVTYDGGTLTLAVTYPNQDITTNKTKLVLTGTIVDAVGKVSVRIKMNGHTFAPKVVKGAFKQTLTFKKAKKPYTTAITITAKDSAGNSSSVTRNVIYKPVVKGEDDNESDDDNNSTGGTTGGSTGGTTGGSTGGTTTSHPFGWTNPRSSHPNYVDSNGVSACLSCHSIDSASKGQPMSCYNCHGKEWDTPSTSTGTGSTGGTTGGTTTSHPFGWTNPRSSHPNYVESNGTGNCVSCHSTDSASKGQPMSCYNCHGKEW